MADALYTNPTLRHDFVILFDVRDGNPNGDPDSGNLPRLDPETMHGLVTDVCLKRKVRDFVQAVNGGTSPFEIYVKHQGILANEQKRAYQGEPPSLGPNENARQRMCTTYYDVRMFGAVMTTGQSGQKDKSGRNLQWNCGQVRGPVQMTFARSIDPIAPLDFAITRVALTNPGDVARGQEAEDQEKAISGQMGRKPIVPYGLYRGHGFFSPAFAERTGATAQDLELFWQALTGMWDLDRSAARGEMACRGLFVFTHNSRLGVAPAFTLFDRITVQKRQGVDAPRKFQDYDVVVNEKDLPAGVTLTRLA